MAGKTPEYRRYVTIQSDTRLNSQSVTSQDFRQIRDGFKGQNVAADLARDVEIANENLEEQKLNIDDHQFLGIEEASDDAFVITILARHLDQSSQTHPPLRVNSLAVRLIGGKVVMIGATSESDSKADIEWSKIAAENCAAADMVANRVEDVSGNASAGWWNSSLRIVIQTLIVGIIVGAIPVIAA